MVFWGHRRLVLAQDTCDNTMSDIHAGRVATDLDTA
jgi:hypothetical protein